VRVPPTPLTDEELRNLLRNDNPFPYVDSDDAFERLRPRKEVVLEEEVEE